MNQDSEPTEAAMGAPRPANPAQPQTKAADPASEVPSDLRALLLAQWNALGEEIFNGHLVDDRRLSDIGRDSETLATISAWFRTKGNITRAAERLHSSRRALRMRINAWRETYPDFVPAEIKKAGSSKTRAAGGAAVAQRSPEKNAT